MTQEELDEISLALKESEKEIISKAIKYNTDIISYKDGEIVRTSPQQILRIYR